MERSSSFCVWQITFLQGQVYASTAHWCTHISRQLCAKQIQKKTSSPFTSSIKKALSDLRYSSWKAKQFSTVSFSFFYLNFNHCLWLIPTTGVIFLFGCFAEREGGKNRSIVSSGTDLSTWEFEHNHFTLYLLLVFLPVRPFICSNECFFSDEDTHFLMLTGAEASVRIRSVRKEEIDFDCCSPCLPYQNRHWIQHPGPWQVTSHSRFYFTLLYMRRSITGPVYGVSNVKSANGHICTFSVLSDPLGLAWGPPKVNSVFSHPISLRHSNSTIAFKLALKTHLFPSQ